MDHSFSTVENAFTYEAPIEPNIPQPLRVIRLFPISGFVAGGKALTIFGDHFQSGVLVSIGNNNCDNVMLNAKKNLITCVTPVGTEGVYPITVRNPDGEHVTMKQAFTYKPPLVRIPHENILMPARTAQNPIKCPASPLEENHTNQEERERALGGCYIIGPHDYQARADQKNLITPLPNGKNKNDFILDVEDLCFQYNKPLPFKPNQVNYIQQRKNILNRVYEEIQELDDSFNRRNPAHGEGAWIQIHRPRYVLDALPAVAVGDNRKKVMQLLFYSHGVQEAGIGNGLKKELVTEIIKSITEQKPYFQEGAQVFIGEHECRDSHILEKGTQLTCLIPPAAPGTYTVIVTNPDGRKMTMDQRFTYGEGIENLVATPPHFLLHPMKSVVQGGAPLTITMTEIEIKKIDNINMFVHMDQKHHAGPYVINPNFSHYETCSLLPAAAGEMEREKDCYKNIGLFMARFLLIDELAFPMKLNIYILQRLLGKKLQYLEEYLAAVKADDPNLFKHYFQVLEIFDHESPFEVFNDATAQDEDSLYYNEPYPYVMNALLIKYGNSHRDEETGLIKDVQNETRMQAFVDGFHGLISEEVLKKMLRKNSLNTKAFDYLLAGPPISKEEVRGFIVTDAGGQPAEDKYVEWVKKVIQEQDEKFAIQLLVFSIGSSTVSSNFEGIKLKKGAAVLTEPQKAPLPLAHTCFDQIEIPLYPATMTYDLFKKKLIQAVEGAEGILIQ